MSTLILIVVIILYLARYLSPAFGYRFPKLAKIFAAIAYGASVPFLLAQRVVKALAKVIGGK